MSMGDIGLIWMTPMFILFLLITKHVNRAQNIILNSSITNYYMDDNVTIQITNTYKDSLMTRRILMTNPDWSKF